MIDFVVKIDSKKQPIVELFGQAKEADELESVIANIIKKHLSIAVKEIKEKINKTCH